MLPKMSMAALPIQRWLLSGEKVACSVIPNEPPGSVRRSS
jgi:hypothetical protein